jgi:general secretion pathway protein G
MKNRQGGFTLVEVIVVAGIIAILAGILVPLILKEIDEARITRAYADIRTISTAMLVLKKDTGSWPVSASCNPAITMLSNGDLPAFAGTGWDTTMGYGYDQKLINDADNDNCWPKTFKGPYIAYVSDDPWGKSYVTNADAFVSAASPKPSVWILSAGPDGTVQTSSTDDTTQGDDIGLRVL